MSLDIETIRKRNEEFANCEDPSHLHPDGTTTYRIGKADIDALLAEVERLQDPILCCCGMPAEAHFPADGLMATWWPFEPYRTTAHSMILTHRTPADVFWQCEHGRPLHPKSGDGCWARYVEMERNLPAMDSHE
jgi:hypothetical protein